MIRIVRLNAFAIANSLHAAPACSGAGWHHSFDRCREAVDDTNGLALLIDDRLESWDGGWSYAGAPPNCYTVVA